MSFLILKDNYSNKGTERCQNKMHMLTLLTRIILDIKNIYLDLFRV